MNTDRLKAFVDCIHARDCGIRTFPGEAQKTEANLAEIRAFGASLQMSATRFTL